MDQLDIQFDERLIVNVFLSTIILELNRLLISINVKIFLSVIIAQYFFVISFNKCLKKTEVSKTKKRKCSFFISTISILNYFCP